jgi:plastocyanin domain-containing protein
MLVAVVVFGELVTWSCQRATVPAAGATQGPSAVAAKTAPAAPAAPAVGDSSRVAVQVTEDGFVPSRIAAKVGKPITLVITRKTDRTCAREILFKGQPGKTDLPLDKEVEATFTPQASGEIPFGCAMGMMVGGTLEVR